MNVGYHKWWSRNLGQEMELKVYGHGGKPVLVFPARADGSSSTRISGWSAPAAPSIDSGAITLFTVDSVDGQSWLNDSAHPAERARRHLDYDRYIVDEVAPFVRERNPHASGILATGCSMGDTTPRTSSYRHPDVFDALVASRACTV